MRAHDVLTSLSNQDIGIAYQNQGEIQHFDKSEEIQNPRRDCPNDSSFIITFK